MTLPLVSPPPPVFVVVVVIVLESCAQCSPYLVLFYSFDSRFAAIAVAVEYFFFLLLLGSHSEFSLLFYGFKFVILQQHISCEFWCFHLPAIFIIFYCIICVSVFLFGFRIHAQYFSLSFLFSSRCQLNAKELKTKTRNMIMVWRTKHCSGNSYFSCAWAQYGWFGRGFECVLEFYVSLERSSTLFSVVHFRQHMHTHTHVIRSANTIIIKVQKWKSMAFSCGLKNWCNKKIWLTFTTKIQRREEWAAYQVNVIIAHFYLGSIAIGKSKLLRSNLLPVMGKKKYILTESTLKSFNGWLWNARFVRVAWRKLPSNILGIYTPQLWKYLFLLEKFFYIRMIRFVRNRSWNSIIRT